MPINNLELFNYWIESSDEDYETMKILFRSQKYTWSLFLGHLVIEKILKAIYAKKNEKNPIAPKTHDLIFLVIKSNLYIPDNIKEKIESINTFNISARYDNYKREFYRKCTLDYTITQIKNIKEVREWLKKQYI